MGITEKLAMEKVDPHSAPETCHLIAASGIARSKLCWSELIFKSFFGGIFISVASLLDIVVAGGAPDLRSANPSIATLIAAFTFPIGFVLTILTNVELVTSNMAVMMYSTLQRKTSWYDLARNWVAAYVFNIAGCLFFAGVLAWWSDTLESEAQSTYTVTQAQGRVNINWGYNFTRGIGVTLGYQHSVANFFLVPIRMFYGTNFGVGKFVYQSIIPVTLGNIVGGAGLVGVPLWFMYGRDGTLASNTARGPAAKGATMPESSQGRSSDETAVVDDGREGVV
ncbi:formate nitrite [Colletotrichum musicola]|uniref:Formate nitrite n=1 Tax=Colletotrichum musicola TaxID=2175873 RepID=A0A8H6IRS6_9PEZI|nr:formate nitrite [Colletotrichum musicola]